MSVRRWFDAARAHLALLVPVRAESRMDEELCFHVEMEAERLQRDHGLPPEEARRIAIATFGGITQHKEALREGRGLGWINGLSLDFRLGLRMMARTPGLTLVSLAGLSIAVAVGAFAFAGVSAVTGASLPFEQSDRIVAITNMDRRRIDDAPQTHLQDLGIWRRSLHSVEQLGGYRTLDRTLLTPAGRSASVRVAEMSAAGFTVTRVAPIRGRYLEEHDERPESPPVVVIGYGIWQVQFDGRDDVIGAHVRLGNTTATVVGVMPREYAFPFNNQAWMPLRLDPLDYERGKAPAVKTFGRLAPGASYADAAKELGAIQQILAKNFPQTDADLQPRIESYARAGFYRSRSTEWMLYLGQLALSLLLAVIGVNVAVLVYARTASRAGEMAIRTALGASRRRIVTQLFVEALVLSSMAAAIGIAIAQAAFQPVEALIRQSADDWIPFWIRLQLTPVLIAYVAGLAIFAAVIIGVIPGLKATRDRVHANLQDISGGSSIRLGRTWTGLLVSQVAISVAALPVSLQAGRGWLQSLFLDRSTPATESVVIATPLLSSGTVSRPGDSDRMRYYEQVMGIARRLEGANVHAMVMSSSPGTGEYVSLEIDHAAPAERATSTGVLFRVEPSFFKDFDIRLLSGREFSASDYVPGAQAAVVNRSFLRHYFAGQGGLGRQVHEVRRPNGPPMPAWQIVGVVEDFPALVHPEATSPRIYLPLRPGEAFPLTLAVRSRGTAPGIVADRIRQVALSVDPTVRFPPIRPLDDMLMDDVRGEGMLMLALMALTVSVVLLSACGIYALMSFTVARRRREIGIRTALGASRARVLAGVLGKSMQHIGIGIVIGAIGSVSLFRLLGDTGPMSEAIGNVIGFAALTTIVGVLATLGPARRVLSVPPNEALRAE